MHISGGKPVLVLVMNWPWALISRGSVRMGLSASMVSTSFSRRSRARKRAGLLRMACWNVSWSVPHRGQVRTGSSLNQEGWAAR